MTEKGYYSYKELIDNKVKYNDMSAYEQTNYMNGLHNESMEFFILIIVLIFMCLLIFMGVL